MKRIITLTTAFLITAGSLHAADALKDTLPALSNGKAPQNFAQMWAGFDPLAEPLEIETLKEWEEDEVVLRIVRFRIGVFKGRKATLAAVYGYPKGASKLPGLLQIHGGGQYADYKACLLNAQRGYATLSIAWAGRIASPEYRVDPKVVKLFWDGATDDPAYRLTTDWGVVDGYHAPGRNAGNQFPSAKPASWTLDSVESPRNSGWFLCALAARRGLTFLEQQPEVDPNKLGVYGHSMGGKLTVLTAVDARVKAAAPSCGGISDRYNASPMFRATLGDDVSLKQIACPIMFLSPANDFHGRIGDLPKAVEEISSTQWRVTCSPHHSHQDTAEYEVATLLWFDQHLKGTFTLPKTPESALNLSAIDGVPAFTVRPDSTMPIRSVDIFYTQHGKPNEEPSDREITTHRFWHHAAATETDGQWTAKLPVTSADKPLWVYANVLYSLESPVTGAGYYYGVYTADTFNLSSLLKVATSEELKSAGVQATLKPSAVIETFAGDWEKEWFTYRPSEWARTTHKLYDDMYQAPDGASLVLEVLAQEANELVVLIDEHAAEVQLDGRGQWQQIVLSSDDFKNLAGEPLPNWNSTKRLKLSPAERLQPKRGDNRESRIVGKNWRGEPPQFRNLRWHVADAATEDAKRSSLLDVFPKSVAQVPSVQQGTTSFSSQYSPSESLWDERLDEKPVFEIEMQHQQDSNNSFQLRIGKGGQIYSLSGPFGESVPPSWRSAGSHVSPWNDEVWQFVAVCSRYNGMEATQKVGEVPQSFLGDLKGSGYRDSFFIHNSGAYIPNNSAIKSLYCPLLASETDANARCFRMLNWGLIPQIKTIHRSPLLYYTQVRDVGDGIIELTWVVHNFSTRDDIVFDHLNAPWGGTRISSLPLRYVSSPDGALLDREGLLSQHGTIDVRKTGGWNISCASDSDDSPSLALVYGRDKHLEAELARKAAGKPYCQFKHSLYRDWRASQPLYKTVWKDWATRPANSFRNYDVCEIIPKLQIVPNSTIWFRSYLVVGRRDKVIRQATSLVDSVDYGLLTFPAEATDTSLVSVSSGTGVADASIEVFTRPVPGTKPLFAIRNTETGQAVITTDPYYFVKQEPLALKLPEEHPHHDYFANAIGYSMDENNSDWQSLIGYAYESKPAIGSWQRLSSLLDADTFPATNRYHLDLWVSTQR